MEHAVKEDAIEPTLEFKPRKRPHNLWYIGS